MNTVGLQVFAPPIVKLQNELNAICKNKNPKIFSIGTRTCWNSGRTR